MRKDLWLAPMSHCVVGRAVGGESCCDKERTVNVAFPAPPGNSLIGCLDSKMRVSQFHSNDPSSDMGRLDNFSGGCVDNRDVGQ